MEKGDGVQRYNMGGNQYELSVKMEVEKKEPKKMQKTMLKSVGKPKVERERRTEDIEVVEEWAIYKVPKRMISKKIPALTHVKKVDVILSSPKKFNP